MLRNGTEQEVSQAASLILNILKLPRNHSVAVDQGVIPELVRLAQHGSTLAAKQEAAGSMANLAMNFKYQDTLLKAGAIRPLLELLDSESSTAQAPEPDPEPDPAPDYD